MKTIIKVGSTLVNNRVIVGKTQIIICLQLRLRTITLAHYSLPKTRLTQTLRGQSHQAVAQTRSTNR